MLIMALYSRYNQRTLKGECMKRLLTLALAAVVAAGVMGASPQTVAAAGSNNCSGLTAEFTGYRDTYQQVELGYQCIKDANRGWDTDFSDSTLGFTGSDNDKLSSFFFWAGVNETWCLYLYENKNFEGQYLTYRAYNGGWVEKNVMPSGWNDRVSSIWFHRLSTISGRCS
jgi:hypothetical protein